MKIGVVGCGALGSYYGAKLIQAEQEVHFLLRSDYEMVRCHGLQIRSPRGDFHVQPVCARDPGAIGECDLVVIGLKTTANREFSRLLPPLVGAETAVLTLQNGLGNEAPLAELFGREKILGGMCFVCLNRLEPGLIHHIGYGKIVLGEYLRPALPRTHAIAALFQRTGVRCQVVDDLEHAHWEKLVWNIPFNGLGVAGAAGYGALLTGQVRASETLGDCLTTDQLLASPDWAKLVRELMQEIMATARGLGFRVSPSFADTLIDYTRTMGAYKASSLIDFERGQPIELESLFLRPLREAQTHGVDTPRLAALCRVLEQINPPR